ncbi:MAG: DUF6443 domain-containing protein [Chitinophagaceae bacterium]|nr:DUF6443 domain-containing protein [Chitinophagaceae bacterium]
MSKSHLVVWAFVIGTLLIQATAAGQAPITPPNPYPATEKVNYIRTWDAVKPVTNPGSITVTAEPNQFKMTTAYFDGLGRSLETVVKKGSLESVSGASADLVSSAVYDPQGREQYKYLPFVANNTGGNTSIADGLFKLNPFQQQAAFYANTNSGGPLYNQNETYFYGQTVYEASPLSRPLESYAAGNSWVGSASQAIEADRHGVKFKYWNNSVADDVKKWNVTDVAGNWGTYAINGNYPAGELAKIISVDEQNKQVIEFKDKSGQILLKKVQLTGTADGGSGAGYTGWLCTYYIYDDLGNLRCVIQPEGVKALAAGGWSLTTTLLDEQFFRYEYDSRNRLIRKKVPGAGDVFMIYDKRDRLVLTQDANLRASNKWLFTKYDKLNRPIMTGFYVNTTYTSQSAMQGYLDAQNMGLFENYQTATFPLYSLNQSFPVVTFPDVLTINYYDDYTWASWYGASGTRNTSFDSHFLATDNNNWPYPQTPVQSGATKGKITGSWDKTGPGLRNTIFYDVKGRVIQTEQYNYVGGVDIVSTQYSWSGLPLIVVSKTQKTGTNAQTTVVVTKMTYDDLGRLVKTEKKLSNTLVNSNAMSAYMTLAEIKYDKLGQVRTKKLAPAFNSNAGLETETFDYNIRGWLLGMNRDYLASQGQSGTNRFGFELGYDKIANKSARNFQGTGLFNGNITGMVWKSDGDDVRRKYDFSYDAANRLLQGLFEQDDATSTWNSTTINYTVKMGTGIDPVTAYDDNGNIKGMTQYGWKLGQASTTPIDNLTYTYNTNSNKLLKVVDANSDPTTKLGDFRDGTNGTGNDYTYDANGNLNLDNNKAISSITYNHLNLPLVITITGKGTIVYTYDAAGNKIKKEVNEIGQPLKTTLYLGGAIYENDVMQFLGTEEGRVRPLTGGLGWAYDYFIKDHLGNVRIVLTDEIKSDLYETLSFEDANLTQQNAQWENANGASINVNGVRTAGISGFNSATGNGSYVRMIKRSTGAIGAGKLMKVMAGDRIHTQVDYFYTTSNSATNNAGANPLTSFVNSLIGVFGASSQVGGIIKNDVSTITNQLANNIPFTSAINPSPSTSGINEAPKAYLNILFFDDQFKYDGTSSLVIKVNYAVNTKQNINRMASNALTANKSGYVYVYFSNESETSVYFDNFMVTHERGSLTEETHYYPFGLTIGGISSKSLAFGNPDNKFKYNGYEQNNTFDLNLYETFYRSHDPQTGRFWQIDPKPSSIQSPYSVMENNPIKNIDFLGDTTYLYTMKGVYKGVLYDQQKTNEVVMLGDDALEDALYFQSSGSATDEALAKMVRDPSVAEARITGETIKSLTDAWRGGDKNETGGYLYVDSKTKVVKISVCKDCGETSGSASPEKIAKTYDEVSKKGKIIGMWHTHPPANGFHGSQPTSKVDTEDPTYTKGLSNGGVGMIVSKATATIYPIARPTLDYTTNRRDALVTTPKYSKDFRENNFTSPFQYGVFNSALTPKTYWTQ